MQELNWEALLIPACVVFAFILIGLYITYARKNFANKGEINALNEKLDLIIDYLPGGLEELAELGKKTGEKLGEFLVKKGPGIGTSVAFRHPEIQAAVEVAWKALIHFCNDHETEAMELRDRILKECRVTDRASVIKIR